jgi:PPK2 family polyphosphate:nucleotide phosphotransferase
MSLKLLLQFISEVVEPYRVTNGKRFKLSDYDPASTGGFQSEVKEAAKDMLLRGIERLAHLQVKLYAQDRWSVLLIFQAMDAAGKDGTIKHVMSGVNPQGCQVFSFKQPSREELDHDYLWRYMRCLPERGRIGIFNRSYYEEALVVRVHEELQAAQKIPDVLRVKSIFDDKLEDIAGIERYFARNGVVVIKFFLNISKKEQKRRFVQRLDTPDKHWKFSSSDIKEREYWKEYMHAYEEAIKATASKESPWYVVPADNKWFTRLVVVAAIVETLEKLNLAFPQVTEKEKDALLKARDILMAENGGINS